MPRRDPFEPATKKPGGKPPPFPFLLDELAELDPVTRPMFGSHGVYVGEKIVFILRDKGEDDEDRGVWVVCDRGQDEAVGKALPRLEPIVCLTHVIRGWKKLAAGRKTFEQDVLKACGLVLKGDPRIGKIPESKKPKSPRPTNVVTKKPAAKK